MKKGESLSRPTVVKCWLLNVERCVFPLFAVLILTADASAATAGFNPYISIVERNPFGLKPPPNPADLVKPPPPVFADIKLQGITTILGRKQVLIKVKVPAKPPEPAREEALVLSEGQRDGEVEVLEINAMNGSIKLNNNGSIVSLNMKDDAEKPTPGAVVPIAPSARPGGVPGVPPPPAAAQPAAAASGSGAAVESFGGNKTLPLRSVRTTTTDSSGGYTGAGATTYGYGTAQTTQPVTQRSIEENVAIYEATRMKNEELIKAGVKLPRMPQHPLIKLSEGSSGQPSGQ